MTGTPTTGRMVENQFVRLVEAVVRRSTDSASLTAGSCRAMETLARPHNLAELIRGVLRDPDLRRLSEQASYAHALGFDKFVLFAAPSGAQLRLHVWGEGEPRLTEDIHNHRFAFVSSIVFGSLVAEYFVLSDGSDYCGYVESASPDEHQWRFTPAGTLGLTPVNVDTMERPRVYALPQTAIHRSYAKSDELTATLLVQFPGVMASSTVYKPRGSSVAATAPQPRFDSDVYEQKLTEFLARLDAAS